MLRSLVLILGAALSLVAADPKFSQPFPPHKVIGNVYYVGTSELSSFLITTPQGHILINSSFEESVPVIRQGIEKLGFKFSDVKILLISHAHDDHTAGSALVKKLTGAKFMVMDADVRSSKAEAWATSTTTAGGPRRRWTAFCMTATRLHSAVPS